MTSSTSHLPRQWESRQRVESKAYPGVWFTVRRMSFSGRLELLGELRNLMARAEFAAAGESAADRMEGAMLEGEIRRRQVQWGLVSLEGLEIDGETATAASLLDLGPEDLVAEVQAAIQAQMGLSEEERKN